jgi:uncharacterized protein (TIGR00369 family)
MAFNAATIVIVRAPSMTAPLADIPQGFERHFRQSPLTDPWEPLYSKRTDRAVIIGLRLGTPHTNGRGLIHGGLIATLADNAMGHSCAHVMGGSSSLVTIGLAVDFVGTAQVGQWLAVEPEVIRTGRTICFAQSLIKADDVVIARANGTFRVVPKPAASKNAVSETAGSR